MASASRRPLKVFQAQFGFFDTVVAAPSRAAALLVGGTHQDLFANGQARITTDDSAVVAALQHPGVLLRRAAGSTDPFQQEPVRLPEVPSPPAKQSVQNPVAAKPKPPRPLPDRSKLNEAENSLKGLDEQHRTEEAAFRRQIDALEGLRATARQTYREARRTMNAAVLVARTAYRRAGGRD